MYAYMYTDVFVCMCMCFGYLHVFKLFLSFYDLWFVTLFLFFLVWNLLET